MAFKRALWHSGLTYQQTCYHCQTLIRYTDYNLDFRPWYPDGFVYCPRCKSPVRHNERFAINEDGTPYIFPGSQQQYPQQYPQQPAVPQQTQYPQQPPVPQQNVPAQTQGVCPDCGKTYNEGIDRFCSQCGRKLVP